MKYIDAGYAVVLAVLAAYAASIAWRVRRLSHKVPRTRSASTR
jgi:hypothetical protein